MILTGLLNDSLLNRRRSTFMPKPFDATMRTLVELEPAAWLRFLRIPVQEPASIRVIDSNISTVSAEADKVLWIEDPEPWIEHLELQASRDRDLPDRVHWYSAIMRHGHGVPIHSTVILLRPAADGPELNGVYEQTSRHGDVYDSFRYNIVRIWERPVNEILNAGLPILPLATVADVEPEEVPRVLLSISDRIAREADPKQAATLWNATRVLMGLRYPVSQVNEFIEGISAMLFGIRGIEESSVYQDILQKGEILGRAEGEIKGRAEGEIEATRKLLLRLGQRKFGPPSELNQDQLNALHDFDQLTKLTERILDISSWDELLTPNLD